MRHRRVWRLVLTGALGAVVLGLAAFAALTRTEWGRDRVLRYTLTAVGGRLNGQLRVERLDGNLITGAKLYGLELRDADGALVVSADSAYADYELPSFFGGDAVLNSLVLHGGEVFLRKLPGDSLWNYQEVLLDPTPAPSVGPGKATIIRAARFVAGEVTVHAPWEPARTLAPREREIAIRDALADTSRLEVTAVEGGYIRRMFFQVADAQIPELVIAGDPRGGTFVRVDSATLQAELYRGDPLDVVDAAGELGLLEGVVRFDAPRIRLPGSSLAAAGTIDMRGEFPQYDVRLSAPRVALRDLKWLYPLAPEDGVAGFEMWLETRGEETLYRFADLTLTAPGTRVVGSFGLLVGEEIRFTNANLTAAPLRVRTIEEMLPTDLPVRGLTIGEVEIRSAGPTRAAGARTSG